MASSLCVSFGGVGGVGCTSCVRRGKTPRRTCVRAQAGDEPSGVSVTTVERAVMGDEKTSSTALVATKTREQCLPTTADTTPAVVTDFLKRKGRHAKFAATMTGGIELFETEQARSSDRGLKNYMALPASQYNTLDGETVTRKGDDTFICELANLDFLGFKLKPILTAKVDVQPDGIGTVIRVEHATLKGSRVVEKTDDLFEIDSVNRVGWRYIEEGEVNQPESNQEQSQQDASLKCEIASETSVTVYLLVPGWFPFSVKASERTGNFVVGQVVKQVVPRFLKQLKDDYSVWSNGDDSREAKGNGDLFDVELEEQ